MVAQRHCGIGLVLRRTWWCHPRQRQRSYGRRSRLPLLDCGPKTPELGQQMPQLCTRKLRPIALAEVLMKLAESCAIGQHDCELLEVV